jgi:hypothetical protein
MICGCVIDIVERFSRYRDNVGMSDLENFVRLDGKWEFGVRPAKHILSDSAPLRASRNFNTNSASFISGRVPEHNVNVAIPFNPNIDNATS